MNIILLGAPGAGKGSQATKISKFYNIPHLSTGDAFRDNIARQTEVGVFAKSFIDKGQLVPDEITVKIVADRIAKDDCRDGFLLDGFPRNLVQAESLAKLTNIDAVINLEVDFSLIINRLTGRRSCKCGESYHISYYKDTKCEKCGQNLYIRDDDNEATISKRLDVYQSQTAPLISYYGNNGVVLNIDGNVAQEDVFTNIKKELNDLHKK